MAEYIEQEVGAELVEKLRYYANTYAIGDNLGREIEGTDELLFEAAEVIEKLIAADVAPVVRGRWDLLDDANSKIVKWNCDRCNRISTSKTDYCPNCGARMDKEEKKS